MRRQTLIESFVPYDQSSLWDQHYAYYEENGLAAWGPGGIPSHSTNNYAFARQHARFLCAIYHKQLRSMELKPDDPLYVLEIGAGIGLFAANLLEALKNDCGQTGRRLLQQLQYILTDYHQGAVHNALNQHRLLPWRNQLVGATFDIRNRELRTLAGEKFDATLSAVYANYVCCVSPTKLLRRNGVSWEEMYVRTRTGKVETSWQKTEHIPQSHTPVLTRLLEHVGDMTPLPYPHSFLFVLNWLPTQLVPGGCVMVNDFGFPPGHSHLAQAEPVSFHYGDTLNHQVHFGIFTELGAVSGWSTYVTKSPTRSLQSCCIQFSQPASPFLLQTFKTHFEDDDAGERLIQLWTQALECFRTKDLAAARELAKRCMALDPHDEKYSRLVERCVTAMSSGRN